MATKKFLFGRNDYRQYQVNDVVNDVVDNAWTFRAAYWASNILVGATENWNALGNWISKFFLAQGDMYFT